MKPFKWILLIAFVVSAYWLWALYLVVALVVLGAYLDTGKGRSRSRVRRAKPHKFKRRKQPAYRPVRYKTSKPYRFPKTRRKWGRLVKIDKVWKL
jgi:hypothetical protein